MKVVIDNKGRSPADLKTGMSISVQLWFAGASTDQEKIAAFTKAMDAICGLHSSWLHIKASEVPPVLEEAWRAHMASKSADLKIVK